MLLGIAIAVCLSDPAAERWKKLRQSREPRVDLAVERRRLALLTALPLAFMVAIALFVARNADAGHPALLMDPLLLALFGIPVLGGVHSAWVEYRKLAARIEKRTGPENVDDLDDFSDVFWLFVGWMALDPRAQLEYFSAPLLSRHAPDARNFRLNPLLGVEFALRLGRATWGAPRGPALERFSEALKRRDAEHEPAPGPARTRARRARRIGPRAARDSQAARALVLHRAHRDGGRDHLSGAA